ncbi:MAG: hypothetical protein AAF327_18105 [Cyanobacteria bacterium P01_A01_bin.37]
MTMKLVLKATLAIAAIGYLLSSAAMAYEPPKEGTGSGSPGRSHPSGTRELDDRGSGRNKHHRPDRPGGVGRAGHGGQKSMEDRNNENE